MIYTNAMSKSDVNYVVNSSEISLERLNGEVVIISFNSGKIKMLKWDRQEHRYYALEADLTGARHA